MMLAALLLSAAPLPATTPLVGLYRSNQIEIAAALELQANGRFRYGVEYGAISEEGEGDWAFDGEVVRLTSNPTPKRPTFELMRDDPAPLGELSMKLECPGFGGGWPLKALIKAKGMSATFEVVADENGIAGKTFPPITSVTPLVPIYGPTVDTFDLAPELGHRLTFRFTPNDIGKAAFTGERIQRDGDDLLLNRYETVIRFERVRPEER